MLEFGCQTLIAVIEKRGQASMSHEDTKIRRHEGFFIKNIFFVFFVPLWLSFHGTPKEENVQEKFDKMPQVWYSISYGLFHQLNKKILRRSRTMKQKNQQKLSLKKTTISNLGQEHMNAVKGGFDLESYEPKTCYCEPPNQGSVNNC
jgi:hypothetical protein